MKSFKFDPSKPGLRKTLIEYEEISLRYMRARVEIAKCAIMQQCISCRDSRAHAIVEYEPVRNLQGEILNNLILYNLIEKMEEIMAT